MRKISVRGLSPGQLTPEEAQEFTLWATGNRNRTVFDPKVLGYPRSAVLIADDHDGPVAYSHCQTVIMAESFIPMPGSDGRTRVLALLKFDEALQSLAKSTNVGDVYCYVPTTEEQYAAQLQKKGWEEIPTVRLFKKSTGIKVGS